MWSRKIRYSYMAGNKKKVLLLLQSLWFGTAPVLENSCYLRWMPKYQYFFSQNIPRVAVPLFWIQFCLGIHTLTGETLSRCLGMLYSGLWTSCISQLTSGMVSLHPYRNIQELGHSSLEWFGQETWSHSVTRNHSGLKKSDTLCSE